MRVAAYDNPLVTGACSGVRGLLLLVIGMLSTLRLHMLRVLGVRIWRVLRMRVILRTL